MVCDERSERAGSRSVGLDFMLLKLSRNPTETVFKFVRFPTGRRPVAPVLLVRDGGDCSRCVYLFRA
jgi:hypothetical protein